MVQLSTLLDRDLVAVDLKARDRDGVLAGLSDLLVRAGVVQGPDREGMLQALREREALASTALDRGVAIPHAYLDLVSRECMAFGRTEVPVSFGPGEEKSDLFLLLAGPSRRVSEHLQLLARTARLARDDDFLEALRGAGDADAVLSAFRDVETRHP